MTAATSTLSLVTRRRERRLRRLRCFLVETLASEGEERGRMVLLSAKSSLSQEGGESDGVEGDITFHEEGLFSICRA